MSWPLLCSMTPGSFENSMLHFSLNLLSGFIFQVRNWDINFMPSVLLEERRLNPELPWRLDGAEI